MHTSLIQLLQIAVAAGVSSHALFNRFEPRPLPFLGMLAAIYVFAAGYMYLDDTHLGVLYSIVASGAIVSGFVTGLMVATGAYRLSPWHPLAEYPGPRLARLSKWYMAFWVATGDRCLKVQE
ncbi:hypothetical protein DXG01_006340 [Tephrocybe rancida]|nr:hypothetical protein DXG01_006340 [Tephrocybe rancida]